MAAGLLTACHKSKPVEILVDKIEISPAEPGMFLGDQLEITVKCYPENATNLDQLTVSNSNPNVADFKNGKLTAKAPGTTRIEARCGDRIASTRVTVYSGYFTKGGVKYGVDAAGGYCYYFGGNEVQEMELKLVNYSSANDTQNFKVWIKCSNLGKEMDITQGLDGSQISVYKNNNEDGYCLPYDSEGKPVIVLADWGYSDATLTKGLLKVEDLGSYRYKLKADFALSNGYTFTADWEGSASMKKE